ncbi:MAG: hypothetical protein KJ879_01710 [Nanoarchaeota archaeon]|nr:hypothetical protein [Nanoarchaeota archaeon]
MVVIKGVSAKSILDSRKEKTVLVSIDTNAGKFSASAPNGKSTGKYEAKSYIKNLQEDIETLKKFSDYFSEEIIDEFSDLRRVEDIVDRHVGANTLFALESAILKALAKEKKKQVWQVINVGAARKFPRLVGNCIGGGKHSDSKKRNPDFQEFLLIPDTREILNGSHTNKDGKVDAEIILSNVDEKFVKKKNDEDAWQTSLDDKKVLEVLSDVRTNMKDFRKIKVDLGVDVAASGFSKRKRYHYLNPVLGRDREEQLSYISNLIKNFRLLYIEDPFAEEDFESFSKLVKKFPNALIVGDDLTATNYKRVKKAIDEKSITALIVKPNQNGSLMEVQRVCELAKKKGIKIIFSHRSGETEENILADLAFGFGADFLKCGITGKEREAKIKRLIEIEKSL